MRPHELFFKEKAGMAKLYFTPLKICFPACPTRLGWHGLSLVVY